MEVSHGGVVLKVLQYALVLHLVQLLAPSIGWVRMGIGHRQG